MAVRASSAADEDGWSHFEDADSESGGGCHHTTVVELPPQLHPAVSEGMKKISSCYFSVPSDLSINSNSVVDLLSMLDDADSFDFRNSRRISDPAKANFAEEDSSSATTALDQVSADLLYHDLLMNVFTFLDANALAACSETAKRLNYEVFYFLQLQLHRAVLAGRGSKNRNNVHSNDLSLSTIHGTGIMRRLANLDPGAANSLVQDFLESNTSLRHMPLSHSLLYLRQLLLRPHNGNEQASKPPKALASAALLVACVGAASFVSGPEIAELKTTLGVEIPNMLLKVGFFGSLVSAAKSISKKPEAMRATAQEVRHQAEQLALRMQQLSAQFMGQVPNRESFYMVLTDLAHLAYRGAYRSREGRTNDKNNLYNHQVRKNSKCDGDVDTEAERSPSGSIGAYSSVVAQATCMLRERVKERRRNEYASLQTADQANQSRRLLENCTSDSSLATVKRIIQKEGCIDAEGFFLGADGTETCAIHTAAFHGASEILDFLCQGLDEDHPENDGGCVDVNLRDGNGWTALHFAAGANSVKAVRTLARHGADLTVEAANGYTPLQWAMRLQNQEVADALRDIQSNESPQSGQPLSALANRFFAFVMVQ